MATSNKTTAVEMLQHHDLWPPDLSPFKSHFLAVLKVLCPRISCPVKSLAASQIRPSKHCVHFSSLTYPQKIRNF
jgi:hypothetical protein